MLGLQALFQALTHFKAYIAVEPDIFSCYCTHLNTQFVTALFVLTAIMLKYKADLRTLAYLVITPCLFAALWHYGFNWLAYLVYLYLAVAVSVITHNHNHINIWTKKWLNVFTDWWLTVFYGLPIFVWIPTHNRNHHRYVNRVEDVTRTYRHSAHNDLTSLVRYPSRSGYDQMREGIIPYMRELKAKNRTQFFENLGQLAVLVLWMVLFFVISWKKAVLYVLIPQQVSQFTVMLFNYVQHVDADEESDYNHSRNFMGVNMYLFNNGYHTVHHQRASMHWSEAPAAHQKIADKIAPELIIGSFWYFMFKTYVLSIFVPAYRPKSICPGRARS
jgi:fatty acid desaturase